MSVELSEVLVSLYLSSLANSQKVVRVQHTALKLAQRHQGGHTTDPGTMRYSVAWVAVCIGPRVSCPMMTMVCHPCSSPQGRKMVGVRTATFKSLYIEKFFLDLKESTLGQVEAASDFSMFCAKE